MTLGVTAVVLVGGFALSFERHLRALSIYMAHAGHVSIYKTGGLEQHLVEPKRFSLTEHDQKVISDIAKSDPNVALSAPFLLTTGLISNGCESQPFFGLGVIPADEHRILTAKELTQAAPGILRERRGLELWQAVDPTSAVALTNGLALRLHKRAVMTSPAPNVPAALPDCQNPASIAAMSSDPNLQFAANTYDGSFSASDANLSLIFSTGFQADEPIFAMAPLANFQNLYQTNDVTYFGWFLNDSSNIAGKAKAYQDGLRARGLDVSVYPWNDSRISSLYGGLMKLLFVIFSFIGVVVLLLVLLSLINSTTMSVVERRREIGSLRALGFMPRLIASLFTGETLFVAGFSGVVGIALAWMVADSVQEAHISIHAPGTVGGMPFLLTPTWELCIAVALLTAAVAALATFRVAARQSRRSIIDLMGEAP